MRKKTVNCLLAWATLAAITLSAAAGTLIASENTPTARALANDAPPLSKYMGYHYCQSGNGSKAVACMASYYDDVP